MRQNHDSMKQGLLTAVALLFGAMAIPVNSFAQG
jgi:hypothetical protein